MVVVAALILVSNPTSTVIFKVLSAVKAGNAIVCAPHPRGKNSGMEVVKIMSRVAEQMGAPKNLIQCLDQVTIQGTGRIDAPSPHFCGHGNWRVHMEQAAYSSGKPTLAGKGNALCYVHKSMKGELDEVAAMDRGIQVILSWVSACVSEQSAIADPEIARDLKYETTAKALFLHRVVKLTVWQIPALASADASHACGSVSLKSWQNSVVFPFRQKRCLVSEESEIGWHQTAFS